MLYYFLFKITHVMKLFDKFHKVFKYWI